MKLRYSGASPFVRKAWILIIETGLADRVEMVATNAWAPDTDLPKDNPIGKVPTLITDDGEGLYDSPVICEYLDSLHQGAKRFPAAGPERWAALRRQALADGMLDAAVARRLETTMRPEAFRWPEWAERQKAVVTRGLAALEAEAASFSGLATIGEIATAAVLGYLDFRFASEPWRQDHPSLATWFDPLLERPSLVITRPQG
jgi:glutathione S-transferase